MGRFSTQDSLTNDLRALGVRDGDGLFVHSSMRAVGPVVGGARAVVAALLSAVGDAGLLALPGFSNDAYAPSGLDMQAMPLAEREQIEAAVLGHDPATSSCAAMGVIAETFRTWPGTRRSDHPCVSVCLNGLGAADYASVHTAEWGMGPDTPFGSLRARNDMKMLLIGVGWNRCTALHTAETLAATRRTKVRRFKTGPGDAPWRETPDVADDLGRLFPALGVDFEKAGAVSKGRIGQADAMLCDYAGLVHFATDWINRANIESGDRH